MLPIGLVDLAIDFSVAVKKKTAGVSERAGNLFSVYHYSLLFFPAIKQTDKEEFNFLKVAPEGI